MITYAGPGTGSISFTGNPTVNLSGNLTGDCRLGVNLWADIKIVQSLSFNISGSASQAAISGNITISSGKTFTNSGVGATAGGLI